MYRRWNKALFIHRKDQPTRHLTRRQVRELVERISQRYENTPFSTELAPIAVTVHNQMIDPGTLKTMKGAMRDESNNVTQTIHVSAGKNIQEQVQAYRPQSPREWFHFARTACVEPVFFVVGPWVVRHGGAAEDNYIRVWGSADRQLDMKSNVYDNITGRRVIMEDYNSLSRHMQTQALPDSAISQHVRTMLSGGGQEAGEAVPASLANVVAAWFLAETARQSTAQLDSLMAMDLVDGGGPLTWPELLTKQAHPVARGGGKERDQEQIDKEIDLTMQWFVNRPSWSAVTFEAEDVSGTDVGYEEATPQDMQHLEELLTRRIDSFESKHESQQWDTEMAAKEQTSGSDDD